MLTFCKTDKTFAGWYSLRIINLNIYAVSYTHLEEKQKDNAAAQEEEAENEIVVSKISESLVASKVNYSINKCDNNDIVNWFE